MAVAIVTAAFTAGAAGSMIGAMAGTSTAASIWAAQTATAAAGWANAAVAGTIGGAVGSAAGAVSQGQAWNQAALNGAITGGLGNYLAGGTFHNNPINSAKVIGTSVANGAWDVVGNRIALLGAQQVMGKVQSEFAESIGLSGEQLNWALMSGSIIGSLLPSVGTRFRATDDGYSLTDYVGERGVLNRDIQGLPFDAIDIALGYQGLPDSTVQAHLLSQGFGGYTTGHSLGTLSANYLATNNLVDNAHLFSMPFGNIAAHNTTLTIGAADLVNGGVLGKALNPNAYIVPLLPWEHNFDQFYKSYIDLYPERYKFGD